MGGGTWTSGENKVRPGVYNTFRNVGTGAPVAVTTNAVACIIEAGWGPFEPTIIDNTLDLAKYFGSSGDTELAELVIRQGARAVVVRLGSTDTGAAAYGTSVLKDTTAVTPKDGVDLSAKYKGTRAIGYTLGDSPTNASKREFKVYVDGTANWRLVETIVFDAGAASYGGLGEGQGLAAAINANSEYLTAAWANDSDNKILAAVSSITALTGGGNPAASDDDDYEEALKALEPEVVNLVITGDVDHTGTVPALVAAYMDEWFNKHSKRAIYITGDATSIGWSTRVTNALTFNNEKAGYVANGLVSPAGVTVDGAKAAAIVAGMIAVTPNNQSITHSVISGYTNIADPLSNTEVEEGLQSGMIMFTKNKSGQIHIEQGINTLVTLSSIQDAGWKKMRRTRTRFELLDRMDAVLDPLIGKVSNTSQGRSLMVANMQIQINQMVAGDKLSGGNVRVDPSNPPRGDSAYFVIAADDNDSMEYLYLTYEFRYSA